VQVLKLCNFDFIDLYIALDFSDYSNGGGRQQVPDELSEDIKIIQEKCIEREGKLKVPEFSLRYDDILYRVTIMRDLEQEPIYILRKSLAKMIDLQNLNLAPVVHNVLHNPDCEGLILIAGRMQNGKTTTATSIVRYRLNEFGGIGVAIEDPPETVLEGLHGNGRCLQIQASRFDGGYKEPLVKTLRTGAKIIFIGEIRDSDTANEVVKASINGHLIVSTIHAGSIKEAIEKYQALCDLHLLSSLAEGLTMVIYQELEPVMKGDVVINRNLHATCFRMTEGVKAKMRNGEIKSIEDDIEQQLSSEAWRGQ
jgi:Tfp pilus assembly pilus retraction ATPase PilT